MDDHSIVVAGLVKKFPGGVTAVDGISFEVQPGEIFGFLGPNGAGKSTTVQVLTTLLAPSAGRVRVAGYDVAAQPGAVRRAVGVALQDVGIDPLLTGRELLRLQGHLFGLGAGAARRRADELLQLVGLTEAAGRRAGTYSGGMRRRLDLALALVHGPRILFLDEPTTGLDPASRAAVWEEVQVLNGDGTTVFLTTQYLEEADRLAGRLAIIDRGRIVAAGSPAELKAEMGGEAISLAFNDRDDVERARAALEGVAERIEQSGQALVVYRERAAAAVPEVVRLLDGARLTPATITVAQPTLDDVFLRATGSRLEGAAKDREAA